MALNIKELGARAAAVTRHRRTRKVVIWSVSLVVAFGVLLGLVAPPLMRGKLAADLSAKLRREVSIEQIKINPYAMTVAVRGFLVKEREGQAPAFSFDELFVNLELQSLFRLAPVIKELRLAKPYLHLVRDEERKYNFQDLVDEFTSAPSDPAAPKARFALNNIEIIDGKIEFEDRPENSKHTVSQIKIGVPFISSLESHVDITVKPEFSALVNGAPFHLAGDTKPFKDTLESSIGIEIEKLAVANYLEYSPMTLNFKVPSGQLHGKISASFKTSKGNAPVLSITGNLGVKELEMVPTGGGQLLKLPSFEVLIDAIEVFANKTSLKAIKSEGLELHVNRGPDGKLNLANLVTVAAEAKAPEPKQEKTESKPLIYAVEEILLESATIHFTDEQPKRPYKTRFDNVNFKVSGLTNEAGKKANIELSLESEAKEKISHTGTLQLTPLLAEGKLDVEGLKPGALHPYYDDALAAEIKDGALDVALQYAFAVKDAQTDLRLTDLNASLSKFRLELAGQPAPLWRIGALSIKDAAVDMAKKTIVIGALEGKDGGGYVQRASDGTLNLARITKPQPQAAAPAPPAAKKETGWRVDLKKIVLDRFRVDLDDRTNSNAAKINLSEISVRADNISTAKNRPGKITIKARVNDKGALTFTGTAMTDPLNGKFAVDGRDIDLVPFQPYLTDQVTFIITSGSLGTKGDLTFAAGDAGAAKVNYQGSAQVADFGTVEQAGAQDLLKWKSLALDAVQFDSAPFQLRIGEITLADFYSRLILGADGKTNLQKLTVEKADKKQEGAEPAKPAEVTTAPPTKESSASDNAVSIGKINLQRGNIHFSDFFVKPNYTANLTGVDGAISELKSETPGEIDLKARLDEAAPVEIKGKINPLSKDLFLDIVADAKEIELNPFTPYSVKYVGYGIERGKLSFHVSYRLESRKLSAKNNIVLNQLTFGERIESPTAIKAPVLLAVALLKDRNGVIDVDLPISGSLDDPQFSVGGIVLRIIVNIITRAVTAPFTLLASAFGSGGVSGEELSYIEFTAGRASLDQREREKIATLAKALNNRPALNLEIIGRVDAMTDLDGLKQVGIERKVKGQKLKELARKGEAPRSLDDVQIDKSEYPRYLKAAYGEESFPKPRNIIGLAQDLPVPEMEKLMMQHAKVGDDDLRELANQRALAVRNALMAAGQVSAERLFIVAGKALTGEQRAKLKGRPNRVDFTMK
jgi:uncharacterized protein involved in outer membrane biogenesis